MAKKQMPTESNSFLRIFNALEEDYAGFRKVLKSRDPEEVRMIWLTARLALIEQRLNEKEAPPEAPGPMILKIFERKK